VPAEDPDRVVSAGTASIVIPAHNEEASIGRLLAALTSDSPAGEFEIVVVCNGCSDGTAARAREFGADVAVVETPIPSKSAALKHGDEVAHHFPRVYLDADVEVSSAAIRAIVRAVAAGPVLAAAPERRLAMDGVSLVVRWYYEVWQELPQVRAGLFGRGVIAVSAEGQERIRHLPHVLSDDLVVSEAFTAAEREVVPDAVVLIRPPKSLKDLMRRRIRVATGNAQADQADLRTSQARTSLTSLGALAREQPRLIPRLPIFLMVTVASRVGARRRVRSGDYTTWLRDESSRNAN
jgi:hypothetical protein